MEEVLEATIMLLLKHLEGWIFRKVAKNLRRVLYGTEYKTADNFMDQLRVLHISDHFLVLNKHEDLLFNSDEQTDFRLSLFDQIQYKYPELYCPQLGHGFYVLHRLDFSTSGVVAVPLHKEAAKVSTKQFQARKTKKFYLALVRGHVEANKVDINFAVGDDGRPEWHKIKMCTSQQDYCLKPRACRTKLLVLERGSYGGSPATKVLLAPITGRRHQLRVHCHELGHTIVGDFTYSNRRDILPHRMFLHALRLVLHTRLENLDVMTEDPFTARDPCNQWTVSETVTGLEEAFELIHAEDGENWLRVGLDCSSSGGPAS